MLIVAERINATRKRIAAAMAERDSAYLAREALTQAEAGAHFIDVNAGSDPAKEVENLKWAVEVVQQNTDLPVCIDSASADGLRAALEVVSKDDVMLNSVSGEERRMKEVLPLAAERKARLVGLLMDQRGLPAGVDDRLEIAEKILKAAQQAGIEVDKLYLDPCVQPLSTNPEQTEALVESVHMIMTRFPGVHTTCGLSNISFGLPYRSILNRVYLALLIRAGLDCAVLDPTERDLMATVYAAEALCGRDEFCMSYIRADRSGMLRPKGG